MELPSTLTLNEAMTICVVFHHSDYLTFKKYDQDLISQRDRKFFPHLVSYNRFVEWMPYTALPFAYFVCFHKGSCTGIRFVDSTTLDVCDTYRIPQHKVFQEVAQRGKSSTGWFYGFKHHLIINNREEIFSFCFTAGNKDDRNPKVMKHLTKKMFGTLFADKGYVSQKLFDTLWEKGIKLITKQKKCKKERNHGVIRKNSIKKTCRNRVCE